MFILLMDGAYHEPKYILTICGSLCYILYDNNDAFIICSCYRETAVLSLWGPHATKFEAESESLIQLGSNAPVVILFAGVTVKIFNSMSLCLLSANDPYLYA